MSTQVRDSAAVRPMQNTLLLPERLARKWRGLLAAGDAAVTLFVMLVVLNGPGNRVAAALLTAAIVGGIFWQCGFYKRSYAVVPRDEVYYACTGIVLAAVPVLLFLSLIGDFSVGTILLALAFCAVGTSALRMRLHLERRRSEPYGGITSITPGAWHDRESASFRLQKRLFDCFIGSLALVIASPVMIVSAIAIAVESGLPIFFVQERIGESGRPFRIFKFRTMRRDADKQWAKPGDSRITRVGAFLRRTSLDELPQAFNVLRGDMSIVGPRPEMVDFASSFASRVANYEQRHVVAPGITGWAQVYLKRNLDPADIPAVLPYDLFYVEHASIVLDCAIVLKTAAEVVFHRAV